MRLSTVISLQAWKSSNPGTTEETLLPLQSFDLPTHKQARLKTKINTHICRHWKTHPSINSHTHFADILSLVVGNETILYTIQTCTSSRLGAVLPVFHYLCLSSAEGSLRKLGQMKKAFRGRIRTFVGSEVACWLERPPTDREVTCFDPWCVFIFSHECMGAICGEWPSGPTYISSVSVRCLANSSLCIKPVYS